MELENGLKLVNQEKVDRAINGSPTAHGTPQGGLKNTVGEGYTEDQLVAEYDRLGGLITKGGRKLQSGCFWDYKKNVAVEQPTLVYEFELEGKIVSFGEDEELPIEIKYKESRKVKKVKK